MPDPLPGTPEHYELMAVRCRAQTGVVPVRLWHFLTSEAKARLGALTQEAARSRIGGVDEATTRADGEVTAEITTSSERAALDDIVDRLGRGSK